MAVIEISTFKLAAGAGEEEFLAADKRYQEEFANLQPGMVRRTTARGGDREYAVIVLWQSDDAADAGARRATGDAVARAFEALVEPGSRRVDRFVPLD